MSDVRIFRHAHLACGIGAGARGFNMANPRIGNVSARFECAGGIDVDAGAIRNFERLTGANGTVMDLFSAEQYVAFHGKAPSPEWREATPADIIAAFGPHIDVCFASMPCKGFSGLLSQRQSETDRYQALNGLTFRGIWLLLEAYKDDPVPVVLFENVPPFVYQPPKRRLRGVGEVIGKLPLPGDPLAGPMHRVPALQWQTWVRLAFVPAGKDWRALNELAVVDGQLRDFGIAPELPLRENALGVLGWNDTAGVLTGQRAPGQGRFSVADPRPVDCRAGSFGVIDYDEAAGTVQGESLPSNGKFAVADPRVDGMHHDGLGVRPWTEPARVVASRCGPTNGAHAVADPRVNGHERSVQLGVRGFDDPAPCVKGDMSVGTGPYAIADPRLAGRARFNNTFRIVRFDEPSPAVAGPGGPAGGQCVADPRMPEQDYAKRKYKVTAFDQPTRAVIGASTTGDGAFAVADPRCTWGKDSHRNKLHVTPYDGQARTVTGADRVGSGAPVVADARREHYQTGGHFGVVAWDESAGTVSGNACHDNGRNSVADPRDVEIEAEPLPLPSAKDRLVCRIVSLDETWHRPFTTLELASLQSIVDPEEAFERLDDGSWRARLPVDLSATSDATKREWIGNAVPSAASKAMAETIGETLLLASMGQVFTLSSRDIWVKPLALALAVDTDQLATRMDRELQ